MYVVNLFAGPGAGKSTTAADVFARLKRADVNCELVTEFAKDKVWENSTDVLENQLYVLSKQHHRLFRLRGNVDVAITDSPLMLCAYYGEGWADGFSEFVYRLFNKFDNMNYSLIRKKKYNPKGRLQTEDEAKEIDSNLESMLSDWGISRSYVYGTKAGARHIANDVLQRLRRL